MHVLWVLGFGHPGDGMGDEPGSTRNWDKYIDHVVHVVENRKIDRVVFCGGPIKDRYSEAEALKDYFLHRYDAVATSELGIEVMTEKASINTFENFREGWLYARINLSEVESLTIVGGAHRKITYMVLSILMFPHLFFTGRVTLSLVDIKGQRDLGKDVLNALRYKGYYVPFFGKKLHRRDVETRKEYLRQQEGKFPPLFQ